MYVPAEGTDGCFRAVALQSPARAQEPQERRNIAVPQESAPRRAASALRRKLRGPAEQRGFPRFFHGETGKIGADGGFGSEFLPAVAESIAAELLLIGDEALLPSGFQDPEKGMQFVF